LISHMASQYLPSSYSRLKIGSMRLLWPTQKPKLAIFHYKKRSTLVPLLYFPKSTVTSSVWLR
jgi:hypothetical protein